MKFDRVRITLMAAAGWILLTLPATASETQTTMTLFNGKDMSGWNAQRTPSEWMVADSVSLDPNDNKKFAIQAGDGIMVNGAKGNTTNIYSQFEHGDCMLHIEFVVPKGSNSGVYLQGLYEIQVLDSYGKKDSELEFSDCGGMYARWDDKAQKSYEGEPPRINASKAPGEWQSFDAVFRAPRFDAQGKKIENACFLVVKHNGVVVHENYEVSGGTRACMNREEGPKGPLMLQGDHGPVAYRNIQITSLNLK